MKTGFVYLANGELFSMFRSLVDVTALDVFGFPARVFSDAFGKFLWLKFGVLAFFLFSCRAQIVRICE